MEPYPHRRRGQLRRAGGLGRVATGRLVDRPLRYAPGIGAQRLCPRACHYLLVLGDHSHHLLPRLRRGPSDFRQSGPNRVLGGRFPVVHSDAGPGYRDPVHVPFHRHDCFPAHCLGGDCRQGVAGRLDAAGAAGLGHCPASRGSPDGREARGRGLRSDGDPERPAVSTGGTRLRKSPLGR